MRKLIFAVITLLAVFNLISAYSGYLNDNNDQTVIERVEGINDSKS